MNPDNPYAAPQTIDPQLAFAEGADNAPRRLFADWDTARVKALLERSNAINDMQVVWLVMCFVTPLLVTFLALPLMFLGIGSLSNFLGFVLLTIVLLTFVRFGTGFARTEQGRGFALAMDGFFGLGCIAAMALSIAAALADRELAFQTVFVLPIGILVGFQTVRCLRALWKAPELFGPAQIRHQDLLEEVEFREQPQRN